ncbi:12421_t:CDS:2, partial [Gigaspora margarita]
SHEEIELAACTQNAVLEQQEQDIGTLENLDDSEIIKVVLDEANQFEHRNPDDSDEEEPEISISEGLIGLNKFICFFEQQTDPDFKAKDLKSF